MDPVQSDVLWQGFAAIPLVIGLVQVAKQAGLPSRFAGMASYLLGILGGLGFGIASLTDWRTGVLQGLWVGMAAAGMFSGIKTLAVTTPTLVEKDLGETA